MIHNFDQPIDRRNSDSAKWNIFDADVIPMWVADMDFATPQPIIDMLQRRVAHGVFGYGMDSAELREVLVARMARLYGWMISPEDIVFLPGLVSALNVVSRAVGNRGDGVLINTPVYGPFLSAPINQERDLQVAPLVSELRAGVLHYAVDFDSFAAAIRPTTRLFLLCNPHNPVGRMWDRSELETMAALCERHDLVICADEIHCDLLLEQRSHVPIASLSPEIAQRTITLMAPSKTFNIPGLGSSFAIVQNSELRKQVNRVMNGIVPHVNILGTVATVAAYTQCADWLAALLAYLRANRDFAVETIAAQMPGVLTTRPEATYLLWVDFRAANLPGAPQTYFLDQARVAMNEGSWFGTGGDGFVRLNLGCTRALLTQALERMSSALAGQRPAGA